MNHRAMRVIATQLYAKHGLKIRFLCVGGINTLVGITCFPAIYFLVPVVRPHYLFLMVVCQIFCISFSYLTNKYFVFRAKKTSLLEYLRFTCFYNIIFVVNLIILPWLVAHEHFNPALVQLVINIFIAMSSYFWHRHITFK